MAISGGAAPEDLGVPPAGTTLWKFRLTHPSELHHLCHQMDRQFGPADPGSREHAMQKTNPLWGGRPMVENAGNASTHPEGAEGSVAQQLPAVDGMWLFWLFTGGGRPGHGQSADGDWLAHLLSSQQPTPAPTGATAASQHLPSGIRAQKTTPHDDPEDFMNAFEHTAVATRWPPTQ